ncbi:MAG: lipoprotein insertase outer membrane protein LolB [Betaproteobacteria bacterium]|nr:lipoprotein insertase outer membrane protein LolB [Betaproteobacteria bacterium]
MFKFAAMLAAVLLAGCASLQRGGDDVSEVSAADVPFHAQGRFSARYEEQAVAARFDWRHAPDADDIHLIAPLGVTVARLTREGEIVTVERADHSQHTQRVTDWGELTTQAFGFSLPVESLAYWIRGVPMPGAAAITRDEAGRIDSLRQQGWEIQYGYAEAHEPERLDIRYGETVGLRLKIDQFVVGSKAQ